MRKIEFRGKRFDRTDNEWIYGGYYFFNNKHYIVQKDIWDDTLCTAYLTEVIPETVGEYVCDDDVYEMEQGIELIKEQA